MSNNAGLKAHRREFVKDSLAEVTLNKYLAPTGTAADTQRTLEVGRHLLERLIVTNETGDNRRLLARTALAFKNNVEPGLPLLSKGVGCGLLHLVGFRGLLIGGQVKSLAQRIFPIYRIHLFKKNFTSSLNFSVSCSSKVQNFREK